MLWYPPLVHGVCCFKQLFSLILATLWARKQVWTMTSNQCYLVSSVCLPFFQQSGNFIWGIQPLLISLLDKFVLGMKSWSGSQGGGRMSFFSGWMWWTIDRGSQCRYLTIVTGMGCGTGIGCPDCNNATSRDRSIICL